MIRSVGPKVLRGLWQSRWAITAALVVLLLLCGTPGSSAGTRSTRSSVAPLADPTNGDPVDMYIHMTYPGAISVMDIEYWILEGGAIYQGWNGVDTIDTGTPYLLAPVTRGDGVHDVCTKSPITLRQCNNDESFADWVNNTYFTIAWATVGGDASNDNVVNALDAAILGPAYFSSTGDPSWDVRADLNMDGIVNGLDASILGPNYFKVGD